MGTRIASVEQTKVTQTEMHGFAWIADAPATAATARAHRLAAVADQNWCCARELGLAPEHKCR